MQVDVGMIIDYAPHLGIITYTHPSLVATIIACKPRKTRGSTI